MADNSESVWKRVLDSLTFGRAATVILLLLLALLVLVIWQSGLKDLLPAEGGGSLLAKLGQVDFGRFMITFLIVLIVVIIAANMAIGLFNLKASPDVSLEKRFLMGKELLTVFIGLLGTLMGFYFAENRVSPDNVQKIANTVQNPGTTQTNFSETRAFESLLKQDFATAVNAFDDAYKATPPSSNIGNITIIKKYLADNVDGFAGTGEKKDRWRNLYCLISNGKMAAGMSKEIIDQFESGCNVQANTNAIPLPTSSLATGNTARGGSANGNSNRAQ